ncbi:hypothetical protein AVEN_19395-1 [Araneus ventricosus]|uniref:Tc1-like transposase DDE domain-containing protein n=1 Tax=Araneus ventricosus TaxID=182803 RepID=A0A4Y2TVN1_ARAVE|nr:hypothetical protein AVEN_19395-1 [Araneus ventricosus]
MGTDAIFMDDNARPHRTRLVRSYLESKTIPQMAWPARSPDLNRVEHVGKTDCRSQCAVRYPARAPKSLTTGMGITATTAINDTIASMPRRCEACISARGYHTR